MSHFWSTLIGINSETTTGGTISSKCGQINALEPKWKTTSVRAHRLPH